MPVIQADAFGSVHPGHSGVFVVLWQRRALGVLAVGGGFAGAAVAAAKMIEPELSMLASLFMVPIIGLYGWGIWCGLRLLEGDPGATAANRTFWAVQIPYLSSPLAGYLFSSGGLLVISFTPSRMDLGAVIYFGSYFQASLFQTDNPFKFGVNLFAIAMVMVLTRELRRQAAGHALQPAPAGE